MKRESLHTGFSSTSVHAVSLAYISLARWLYEGYAPVIAPINNSIAEKTSRNESIRQRHEAGETLAELAAAYGISEQRVHQIIHHRRK